MHAGIEEDPKFKVLYRLLHDLCVVNKGQAIIFVRLHATAAYLGKRLQAAFKPAKLQVACTVTARGDLKSLAERQLLREQFAPVANSKDEAARYQLLVCTDADGVGVNLQDAANVINYDLPVSADGLVQRLGRILRPARYAGRVPHMYTFIPDCLHPSQTAPSSSLTVQAIAQLVERLRRRHVACSQLLGFPVLGTNSDPYIPLDVAIDPAALDDKLSENWQGLSTTANTWTSHIASLEEHRSMLSALPKVLHSARLCKQRNPQVIVLLEYDKGVVPIVYDLQSDRLIDLHDLPILNLLRADPAEKPAGVNMPRIMRYADLATRRWCERTHVRPKLTKRMAALYLHPEHQAEDFDYLLKVE